MPQSIAVATIERMTTPFPIEPANPPKAEPSHESEIDVRGESHSLNDAGPRKLASIGFRIGFAEAPAFDFARIIGSVL
jgi:hypothetical protein